MGRVLVLVVLACATPVAISGQTLVVLHIRGSLTDASGQARPLARHVLLISDEPQTQETRKIVTSIDGTADVRLRPGHYVVESDQPIALQGQAYRWRQTLDIVAGRDAALELTAANAVVEPIAAGATDAAAPLTPGVYWITLGDGGNDPLAAPARLTVWRRQTLDGRFHGGKIDINAFMEPSEFKSKMDEAIQAMHSSELARGAERIYVPGEMEWLKREERLKNGIPVAPAIWKDLTKVSQDLGIDLPATV